VPATNASRAPVTIGSFACVFGDVDRKPAEIPGFAELWAAAAPSTEFGAMGCDGFRTMSGPAEDYVTDSVRQALAGRGVAGEDVDHVVLATSDATLRQLSPDFAARVLDGAGMRNCVPAVLSFQQCCSSLAALRYAGDLFSDKDVRNVVLVALDRTPEDKDRVRSFALFSDAAVSCVLSRGAGGDVRLRASAVRVDYAGLTGHDSFASRQQVAQAAFGAIFRESGASFGDVTAIFSTNLYKPATLFNAAVAGASPSALHFADSLRRYGHCGNCDWMINLVDFNDRTGLEPDAAYVAQSSAPGFFACALLTGV
jgi:hypothetical protein